MMRPSALPVHIRRLCVGGERFTPGPNSERQPELKCNLKEKISHVGNVSMVQLQDSVSLVEGIAR